MARIAKSVGVKSCDKTIDFKFYAPLAKKVCLGGTFNNWKAEKHPLKKDATGNWKASAIPFPMTFVLRCGPSTVIRG